MDLLFYERLKQELTQEKYAFKNELKTLYIVSLEDGTASGIDIAYGFIKHINMEIEVRTHKLDGQAMKRGDILLSLLGMNHETLPVARLLVRLISRMSGIATLAKHYVTVLYPTQVLDAHFYTPGIKTYEKDALMHGGVVGVDFRLVSKEEIYLLGGLKDAYEVLKKEERVLCYEITTLKEFYDILDENLDIHYVMVTNFNDDQLRQIHAEHSKLTLIPHGLFKPDKLEFLKRLEFKYIETSFLTKAARSLEISYAFE